MSLSTLKPAACRLPPAAVTNGPHSNVSHVSMVNRQALPPLQVREKGAPLSQECIPSIHRREMMYLGAASLGFLSLLSPASAEARPRNATMRQKILEKLEELRQKAGLGKPKDESGGKGSKDEKDEKFEKPKIETKEKKSNGDEKKPATTPKPSAAPLKEEPAVPTLPNILNGNTVETTLP